MHKPQILSTPAQKPATPDLTTPDPLLAPAVLVFDACHLGVVLRAVLGVELLVAVAALYRSSTLGDWWLQAAWLTSGGLPATLVWLLLACSLSRWLQRRTPSQQYATGIALGSLAGVYGSGMLALTQPLQPLHWVANSATAGLVAAVLVGWLVLRARARTPAAMAAQLAMLQASIRPHFLFNTLNSAVALVRDEPAKAERLLEDLGDLFRAALQDQGSTIALRDEVELARRYLDIEQVRFGDRMTVHWEIEDAVLDTQVPPLLLQPLVENAVKHGVEPFEIGTKVTICAYSAGKNFILLRVTNTLNLDPLPAAQPLARRGLGMALANVERRLRLLHDVNIAFTAAAADGVFEVRISLPR